MRSFPANLANLKTQRLTLRAMLVSDKDDLFAIYGDPKVMRFASDEIFSSLETVDVMLSSVGRLFHEQSSIEWGIEQCDNHKLVGTCGLHSFDSLNNSAQIGCMLKRSVWGHGYMQEALDEVIQYAFQELEITLLRADIDDLNYRSVKLFTKLGFAYQDGTVYIRSAIRDNV